MKKSIYLDAAASGLKPESVIKVEMDFLKNKYANSSRGVCEKTAEVDSLVDSARKRTKQFINASAKEQIIFTSSATDGLNRITNILANSDKLTKDSFVAVSDIDHHSARLPWEVLAKNRQCRLVKMPLDSGFNIDIDKIPFADIMVLTAMSNVMGMPQNVAEIIRRGREKNKNLIVIVDAAQYIVHFPLDVRFWDADFVCFSGHKIGADTGLGIMYVKNPENFMPDKFGGGMVNKVFTDANVETLNWDFNSAPEKFEAGTLPLTQIVGLPAAIDYLEKNRPNLELIGYLYDELSKIQRIKILTNREATMLTFTVDKMHPLDFGVLMGAEGFCIRVGNMCASWIHSALGISGSIRISVGSWNTKAEIKKAIDAIRTIVE